MTGSEIIPRPTEQPRDDRSLNERPKTGATQKWVSLPPAFGSCGCSTDGVDRKPTMSSEKSHLKMTIVPTETLQVEPTRRSALVTADALPKNLSSGGNELVFSIDRLFHRRFISGTQQSRSLFPSLARLSESWSISFDRRSTSTLVRPP